jgi:hypothetical protein
MTKHTELSLEEIKADVASELVVPLWPHAGRIYGLGRCPTYAAAKAGEIETVRLGKLIKAVTAPMRKRLGMESAA